MDPSERLYRAICGGIPDRVPVVPKIWVDLGASLTGTPLTHIISNPLAAIRVIVDAGVDCGADAVRVFHFPSRKLEISGNRVLEINQSGEVLGEIDTEGGLSTHLRNGESFDLTDMRHMAYHQFWSADEPFIDDVSDVKRAVVPDKSFYDSDGCAERQRAATAGLDSRIAVIGDCGSATMAFLVYMRGMGRALMDLVDDPPLVHKIMELGAAIAIEKAKFNIDLGINVLRLNDSVGNMNVISPEHWREFVMPHMKDVCDSVHAYDSTARIYCHICGNVLPIAEDLVATGIDCIGPMDPLGGCSPRDLRNRIGDSVSLMGGVNTITFLNGKPADIIAEAVACIRQAGEHGGYILGSGCVVPRKSPLENVLALRTAADRAGVYEKGGVLRKE